MDDGPTIFKLLSKLNEAQRVAQIGSWDWEIDTGEVWWSEETYRLFGVSPTQFKPGFDNNARYIHPDDLGRYQSSFARSLETGEPLSLEVRICAGDGQLKVCLARAELIRGDDGTARRFVGTIQDITERKAIETERDRLIAAVEQASEIIFVVTTDARVDYVNPAFEVVTGFARDEVIGQNVSLVGIRAPDDVAQGKIWDSVRSGCRWRGRLVGLRKNDTHSTYDATVSPVRDASGQVVSIVVVARDITQQLELEGQLLASQKMDAIGRLAGGVAHDFNNLLSVILNCADFALQGTQPEESRWQDLHDIKTAAERAAALTGQLLAFSRKQVLEPIVLDLNEVVSALESMLHRLLGEGIELELRCGCGLDLVKADRGQLQQVMMNLVINARDAMPNGGKLTIETANVDLGEEYAEQHYDVTPGKHVMLAVSDTGHGLDATTREKMFEPFYTTKQMGRGTGLGLSTVYGIVKQSGGRILVYSELGHGTTFKVYFPRCEAAASSLSETSQESRRPLTGSETILLVEDEEGVRKIAERMLRNSGYRVLSVADGQEALLLVEQVTEEIHLLLTDVVLPHMSGRQLAERLIVLHPKLRVLYMSGYTDNAIVHHGVLDPGTRFIGKPFTMAALSQKVREALD